MDKASIPGTGAQELRESHSPEQIRERLAEANRHSYLRDFVYGAIDGTVTTFAVVSAVAGAGLSSGVIIIMGIANLVADGFSMAASNYLGTKAEEDQRKSVRRMEEEHIRQYPEGEQEEIRQIFAGKGFAGDELEHAVRVITSDRKQWVDTMLVEEFGLPLTGPSALKAASVTLLAFIAVGAIPLLPFLVEFFFSDFSLYAYRTSVLLTGVAFFLVGAAKSWFVDESWLRAGLLNLLIGGAAAGIAFGLGMLFGNIVEL